MINQFNPKNGVWVFKVNQAGDVIVKGLSQIYHIAVTDQVKTFSKVGKATESRDCFIDYSQSGVYTKNSLTAYHAQSSAQYDNQKNIISLEKIDVMKANVAGLLLYNDYKATVNGKEVTEHGATPEQARSILPNSLKTEIVMTMNLREWRHFFKLRCAKAAHPQAREIANMILKEFKEKIPVIFDDINEGLMGGTDEKTK